MTSQPPIIHLLSISFHKFTAAQLVERIVQSAALDKKTIIANVNVRAMNFAYDLPWFRDFLNRADWVFCDGVGVALGAKLAGLTIETRFRSTCPDWIEQLARGCAEHNRSLFLLAGKPGVAEAAAAKLKQVEPDLQIGFHHGYFEKTGPENETVIAAVNQFKPDILYVGFGMPLQEQWIKDNMAQIEAKVFLPLGACLDFYTGQLYRGPKWMTDNGLEWLARLLTEPRRLWKRYLLGNPVFLCRVLKQKFLQTR